LWPYTPSHEVKDLHNPFYRGCWHEFSLCLHIITFIIFIINLVLQYINTFYHFQKLTGSYLHTLSKTPYCSQCSGIISSPLWQNVRQNLLDILGLNYYLKKQLPNTIKAHFIYYAFSFFYYNKLLIY